MQEKKPNIMKLNKNGTISVFNSKKKEYMTCNDIHKSILYLIKH